MATDPKPGARNDLEALKKARRFNREAAEIIEKGFNEVDHMVTRVGRPDYGPIKGILGQLSNLNAEVFSALDEMLTLRKKAGMVADTAQVTDKDVTELRDRLQAVEAQLAGLYESVGVKYQSGVTRP